MSYFRAAAVFSDNMVIQRGKPVKIWGSADTDGTRISVDFCGKTASASVFLGKWEVLLPSCEEYCEDKDMVITDGTDTITFRNIAVGEVWLAGGQSNMEFELQNCKGGADELCLCKESRVRFYYTPKNPYIDEKFFRDERNTRWQLPDEENSRCWSAVGYYFGKKLAHELGCTVGIIGCNWGGTSASAWISRETLLSDPETRAYADDYDEAMRGKTVDDYLRELTDYRMWEARWNPKIAEYYSTHTTDADWDEAQAYAGGLSRYPEPLGPRSPFRAGGLYETMLCRVKPYTIAGFIYYQGESDDHRARSYHKLLDMLIREWRYLWNDDTLPFLNVQLPMFMNKKDPPDRTTWCFVRESQLRVHLTTANTGLAVITDKGEFDNIHPLDKAPVGERLALQGLCHVYKKIPADKAYGPIYRCHTCPDGGMLLEFSYADGMYSVGEPEGFEIAAADGIYHPAKAELRGNTVFLSSDEVAEPVYARYEWYNWGKVSVFGANGIPMSPFRTSRSDGSV
ncbi:MAG: sialate O-acetylesterase [Oscillospiraceae bacterium]|nr:sialate O-acetylesterase [Oscillospiraceae bacterium]